MNEQLIIRAGSLAQDPLWWLVWSSQGEVIASGMLQHSDELATLAARLGTHRPVVLLLPASEVALKELVLPSKPSRQ